MLGTKVELKAEQDKIVKLQTHDLSYFLGKIFFGDDGSQNMIFYQPKLETFVLKKDKDTDYVLSLKSKGVYNFKHKTLYTAFLDSIKLSGYKVGIEFDKDPLAAEQNNYATKIVNVYIVRLV